MLPFALVFIACGFVVACVLIYYLCAYCIPLLCAVIAAQWAWATGAGPLGSFVIGAVAFAATMTGLQLAAAAPFSRSLRWSVLALTTLPAFVLAYSLSDAVLRWVIPSLVWRALFAITFSATAAAGAIRGLFPFRAAARSAQP